MTSDPPANFWLCTLLARWRWVLLCAVLSGVLGVGAGFLIPKKYEARASLLPPHEPDPGLRLFGLKSMKELENLLPFSADVTLLEVFIGILQSDRVARNLSESFALSDYYGTSTQIKTLAKLRSNTRIGPNREKIIEVRVTDKDPAVAAALANGYVTELGKVFRATRSGAGKRQREFLEVRVEQARAQLDSLGAVLVDVQTGGGITAMARGGEEAAAAAAELLKRRFVLAVELETLDALSVGDAPLRRQREAELRVLDAKIATLPGLGADLVDRLRDLVIQEKVFETLNEQLEAARLEEVRDTPVLEVLDVAVAPDRHVWPRKGLMGLAAMLLGAYAGLAWAVYTEPAR